MGKYLDPRADLTFKKVFGEHKNLVISLLNALLPLKDEERVESIEYWPAEKIPDRRRSTIKIHSCIVEPESIPYRSLLFFRVETLEYPLIASVSVDHGSIDTADGRCGGARLLCYLNIRLVFVEHFRHGETLRDGYNLICGAYIIKKLIEFFLIIQTHDRIQELIDRFRPNGLLHKYPPLAFHCRLLRLISALCEPIRQPRRGLHKTLRNLPRRS